MSTSVSHNASKRRLAARKTGRLEVRVSDQQKELVLRAAQIKGLKLSEFVTISVQIAAENAIREHEIMTLTAQESRAFAEALLNPPAPNANLIALAKEYRQSTRASE